jgi:signal transduction histidine kinase/FixJ family two-component response regulator
MERIIGASTMDFIPKENLAILQQKIEDRKKGISEAFEMQIQILGKKKWWLVSSAPRFNEAHEFVGTIVICLDINQQKQLEVELREAREQAEELAQAKQNFLANMSHEIRTPMNAIMGMSSQLTKTKLSGQQKFYLDTIHTAADNLLVIINDILDLSKIDAGKLSIEEIGFEPKVVVGNAMQVLLHKAEEKGIQLTNSYCDSKMAPVFLGDPYRLNQVLLNLISNAIKFTEKGSVDLTCEVIHETDVSQTIRAKVTDTGIGMDESFVVNLFQKFNQADKSVTRRFGGTGLGMSITQQLIQLMGGTIRVDSQKNKGTTVSFELAFKKGRPADLPVKEVKFQNTALLAQKTILVVDDNDMNRLVAATMLENYQLVIREACNGVEAIDSIREQQPDLVLMDLQMPVLNGLEATKRLRETGNQVPVVALTANAIKGEQEKCLEAGMNDYLSKPYTEEDLLQTIIKWIGHQPSATTGETQAINESPKTETLYDLSGLAEISRGNQAFVDKMIHLFCEQTPGMLSEMISAHSSGDFARMGALAHKMKPGIDNLRIHSLKQVIRSIEKSGKENQPDPQLETLLQQLNQVLQQVMQQMKQQSITN